MVTRILQILKEENLTASQFADIIDVQRSSMSHILSGRNNPSLDFVHKILKAFPNVNTDWLMFGTGTMYNQKIGTDPNLKVNAAAPIEGPTNPVKPANSIETLDLFGDFTPQPAKDEMVINVEPVVSAVENRQNVVEFEDAAITGIKNTNAESYTQKQADITRSESNISSTPKEMPEISNSREVIQKASLEDKEIDRIVIFYSDNTFSMYKPEKR